MPLMPVLADLLARASRALGLETVDAFPAGHPYARTRWDRAYFDIASDLKPDAIERAICEAIANTPAVFGHITNPTPRMQRTLLAIIDERLRRSCGYPADLLKLLVAAYDSPYTLEPVPGLRAAVNETQAWGMPERAQALLAFLRSLPPDFDVFDAQSPARTLRVVHSARR
jgi:hypothetical protein